MEDLVFLSGIGRNKKSYKGFFSLAPKNWNLHFLNSVFLMQFGQDRAIEEIGIFLDKNNIVKANLVGHSLGGGLALLYASRYSKRVNHLFLLDSIGVNENKPLLNQVVDFFHARPIRKIVEDLKAIPTVVKHPILFSKLSSYVRRVDLQNEAENINVPTTIMWGEDDPLVSSSSGKKLSSIIKNSKFIVFSGVGHDWSLHNPELFWQNIKNG